MDMVKLCTGSILMIVQDVNDITAGQVTGKTDPGSP